jgi:hypothetical protein
MTELELKVCRGLAKGLALRLRMLKARLRVLTVKDDVLCLGLTGTCSADGDDIVAPHIRGQRIVQQLQMTDADKLAVFRNCLKTAIARVFEDWPTKHDALPDCAAELERVIAPMAESMMQVAASCVRRRLKVSLAWGAMAAAFDEATAGKASEFAVRIVLAPAPRAVDDAKPKVMPA